MIRSFFYKSRCAVGRCISDWEKRRIRFVSHFTRFISVLRIAVGIAAVLASLFCLIELTLYLGFDRKPEDDIALKHLFRIPQGIFLCDLTLGIFLKSRRGSRNGHILKWIVGTALVLSALSWIYPRPDAPWLPFLKNILYSDAYLFAVLATYSILKLCQSTMRLIGRRTNPALILSGSFIIFILIGSFLLMLPKCTHTQISYYDSLFIATSAVSITGLTPVDVATAFTPLGLLVLSILVQIGGLGVITFTSFFAIFFSGTPSIYSQLLIKDVIYSKTINNLIPTLLYILTFTLTVELIGAVAVYFTIPASLGLTVTDKIIFAGFHSLCSFCNAGFSCLPGGMSNPALLNGSQSIYVVTSALIFAGAIGFPILVNFKEIFAVWLNRIFSSKNKRRSSGVRIHLYDLNTKLVLITTLTILAVASVTFFILEYNNTLAGMDTGKKITQSVFNSLTPRSAGFASVNPAAFLPVTMLLVVIQMWIGGASQSLAGGIKVNSFAAIILNLRGIIRGNTSASAFGRRISVGSVRRANAVLAASIIAFIIYSACILLLEPHIPVKSVVFEVISALFTVGTSLGITDQLCPASKIILSTAMFAGRVGILSLLIGFGAHTRDKSVHYPTENIIIS